MTATPKIGNIELARRLCYEIAGPTDEEDSDGSGYGSVDVAEILSAEVVRLRGENAVLRDLLRQCNTVLLTIEPESAEEYEAIGDLSDAIERAIGEAGGTLL